MVKVLVHRLSWDIAHPDDPIPPAKVICHRCDNPPCVNPAHLFVGSRADNLKDMYKKQRHSYGEDHYQAKLSEKDVLEIRANTTATFRGLAAQYGVDNGTISAIRYGRSWKHLL